MKIYHHFVTKNLVTKNLPPNCHQNFIDKLNLPLLKIQTPYISKRKFSCITFTIYHRIVTYGFGGIIIWATRARGHLMVQKKKTMVQKRVACEQNIKNDSIHI